MNGEPQPSLNQQLFNAVAALTVANDQLRHRRELTERARREETLAMNLVNEEQKKFDVLVAQVKAQAPRDSDWKRPPSYPVGNDL